MCGLPDSVESHSGPSCSRREDSFGATLARSTPLPGPVCRTQGAGESVCRAGALVSTHSAGRDAEAEGVSCSVGVKLILTGMLRVHDADLSAVRRLIVGRSCGRIPMMRHTACAGFNYRAPARGAPLQYMRRALGLRSVAAALRLTSFSSASRSEAYCGDTVNVTVDGAASGNLRSGAKR